MLIGFTIVAAPLLFRHRERRRANESACRRAASSWCVHGMQGTRNNQRMFEEIGALEHTARLYQIIGSARTAGCLHAQPRAPRRLRSANCWPCRWTPSRTAMRCALEAEADRLQQELTSKRAQLGAHGGI